MYTWLPLSVVQILLRSSVHQRLRLLLLCEPIYTGRLKNIFAAMAEFKTDHKIISEILDSETEKLLIC